jgi:hypothetical protein
MSTLLLVARNRKSSHASSLYRKSALVILLSSFILLISTVVAHGTGEPTTTITLDPSSPNGGGGWYKTTPTITLTPDEPATTYYQWDSTSGSWTTYSVPFSALEGDHTLYYYSVDTENNTEEAKNTVIKVDTTAPSMAEQTPANATTVNSYRPTVSARLSDASSGIDPATILMKLDGTPVSHSYDPGTGIVSYTPSADLTRGRHDVYVSTSDIATNSASSSWHFTVFGTPVSGTISSNTTWAVDGSPYIVTGIITVNSGVTLTIQPGTIVKFEFGNSKRMSVSGSLVADGTPESKIVFTSVRDDSYAGDTNNDGSATVPQPGDWEKITLTNSSSVIDNVVIKYGGGRLITLYGTALCA